MSIPLFIRVEKKKCKKWDEYKTGEEWVLNDVKLILRPNKTGRSTSAIYIAVQFMQSTDPANSISVLST